MNIICDRGEDWTNCWGGGLGWGVVVVVKIVWG